MTIDEEKKFLREYMLERREGMSSPEVYTKSVMIENTLFSLEEVHRKNNILFYAAFRKEVETLRMMQRARQEDKRVFVPIPDPGSGECMISELFDIDNEMTSGIWGIPVPREECIRPVSPSEIETVIVPGVLFDKWGERIGFGKGFYDRLLAGLEPSACTIGICYDFQLVIKKLPSALHDIRVSKIITEKQHINCNDLERR